MALGLYDQALQDLCRAIENDPTNAASYLQRGAAHFGLGQYENALEDFQSYTEQTDKAVPLSVLKFSLGFTNGLPKGVFESGESLLLFFVEFVKDPIHTSTQVIQALGELANLAKNDEWGLIGETLSPELFQLITEWETLPSEKRGELAGYALGKHGGDILIPGGLAKVASKIVKSAKELAAVCKNLQIAQETLVLEAATGVGGSVKVAEIIEGGRKTVGIAEELGFSRSQMAKLKEAGQLEGTIGKTLDHFAQNPALRESYELFAKAQEFLKPYKGFISETECRELIHSTGIKTFPRPEGLPENFRVKISNNGAGMKYVDPKINETNIRVMPGKPHSPFPHQQKPYVIQMKNGQVLDKFGDVVGAESPQAYIPLEEFIFNKGLFGVN